jgi:hypothetical protein
MKNTIKVLTYTELTQLSDSELTKCVGLALSQLDEAVKQGENTIEKAQIYQVYENELAKRHYLQRAR